MDSTHAADVNIAQAINRPCQHRDNIFSGRCGSASRQTIYVSPALEVAAFPVYSTVFPLYLPPNSGNQGRVQKPADKKKKKKKEELKVANR